MEQFSRDNRAKLRSIETKLNELSADPWFKLASGEERVCDIVFAGGGAKGVAHLGALWALDKLGVRFKRLAGNSVGAITAAFVAAGYDIDELIENLFNMDFIQLRDSGWSDRLPRLAMMVAVSTSFGMYEGEKVQIWIEEMMAKKRANTFGRLPRGMAGMLSPIDEGDGHRLTVIASDITHAHEVILPRDLSSERYGRHNIKYFPIAAAVRMSISVPFFFTPFKLHNSLIVDGAFASNLPLEIFDLDDASKVRWPTLGINLTSDPSPPHEVDDLLNFGLAIFDTMRHGQSKMSVIDYPTRMCRLIDARTDEVKTLDFGLKKAQKERLFINGARAVLETLHGDNGKGMRRTWNFDNYIRLRKRFSFPSDPFDPYFTEGDFGA
ncbi:MAG: patatin-like phospholipase family protein [Candidatus Thermoplasmatota archaeon]|nr:patatin-like phospholipase family protein [Candidatus Thermoplasmatota archaeon]